jgi:hypothetical protein
MGMGVVGFFLVLIFDKIKFNCLTNKFIALMAKI